MVPLLIGIVGSRNTGKTTFTLKCSQLLGETGLTIFVIKFSSSHYSIDPEGKDSALYHDSNVNSVIFTSPYETVTYKRVTTRSNLDELQKLVPESVDIVLCESYPPSFPKIPLIFVIRSFKDYEETKLRYNNQEPILVIKSPSTKKKVQIEELNTLSVEVNEDRKEIINRIHLLMN
ncbi:MAG: molybdopterin-guanine dinucleotide biosynthesis protein B [Candidatus Hodarchaeales archaeon]|jgi:molybdopterin-guanine dinucleotide biosynthesis protein MobB